MGICYAGVYTDERRVKRMCIFQNFSSYNNERIDTAEVNMSPSFFFRITSNINLDLTV